MCCVLGALLAVRHSAPAGTGGGAPANVKTHISPMGADQSIACGGIDRSPIAGPRSTARSIGSSSG